jgi:DNA-binding HxlR family transcriptional regulator
MIWDEFSTDNCPVGRTLEVIGAPWTLLIVREAFKGVTRYDEFQRRLGVSRALLSQRLSALVEKGILERLPYREGLQRERNGYYLTAKGRDLYVVIAALRTWGEQHALDEDGPPVIIRHAGCGGRVRLRLECEEGHEITSADAAAEPGPGARPLAGATR